MNLDKLGTILKRNTKTKMWWPKMAASLVLSNIFFFMLFGGHDSEVKSPSAIPDGWVEVQLNAELLTPFHYGKKVLIIHRIGRKKLEGVLQAPGSQDLGKLTLLVKESEAHALFQYEAWEVLPYLKNMSFAANKKDQSHEIRY